MASPHSQHAGLRALRRLVHRERADLGRHIQPVLDGIQQATAGLCVALVWQDAEGWHIGSTAGWSDAANHLAGPFRSAWCTQALQQRTDLTALAADVAATDPLAQAVSARSGVAGGVQVVPGVLDGVLAVMRAERPIEPLDEPGLGPQVRAAARTLVAQGRLALEAAVQRRLMEQHAETEGLLIVLGWLEALHAGIRTTLLLFDEGGAQIQDAVAPAWSDAYRTGWVGQPTTILADGVADAMLCQMPVYTVTGGRREGATGPPGPSGEAAYAIPLHEAPDPPVGMLVVHGAHPLSEAVQADARRAARLLAPLLGYRRMARALQRSEERSRYVERVSEGVWSFDLEPPVPTSLPPGEQTHRALAAARLAACNDTLAQMYGFERADEVVGLELKTVLPTRFAHYEACLRAFIEGGYQLTGYELEEWDRYGGRHFFAKSLIGVVEDGALVRIWGAQVDVSKLRRAQQAQQESEALWRRLVERHPVPLVVSTDATIRYVNPAGAALLGLTPEQVAGTPLGAFLEPRDLAILVQHLKAVQTGGTVPLRQYTVHRADGTRRRVEIVSVPGQHGGQPAVQSVWQDVTDRVRYERGLLEAKERAEEMDRVKTTFLMNMSHEIRTPITAILGFSELMVEEATGEQQMQARLIRESGRRLFATLNAVLDLAQLEGGMLRLEPRTLDVAEQALRVLYLFKHKAMDRGLQLRLAVDTGRPVYALLDQRALSRVLESLVGNAVKFTHEGSVEVRIDTHEDDLVLRVADTGIGIASDFVERTFEAFEQESGGIARNYEGSGLGLTVARRFVELMGGRIEVESEKGQGSRFNVYLPGVVLDSASAPVSRT